MNAVLVLVFRHFSFQPAQMSWSLMEENFQALAEAAGAVPQQVVADDIADPGAPAHLWHVPEGPPVPGPAAGPPVMNGVHPEYEGELVDQLNAALAMFGQGPLDDPPGWFSQKLRQGQNEDFFVISPLTNFTYLCVICNETFDLIPTFCLTNTVLTENTVIKT
jgi:hypothetical protein